MRTYRVQMDQHLLGYHVPAYDNLESERTFVIVPHIKTLKFVVHIGSSRYQNFQEA